MDDTATSVSCRSFLYCAFYKKNIAEDQEEVCCKGLPCPAKYETCKEDNVAFSPQNNNNKKGLMELFWLLIYSHQKEDGEQDSCAETCINVDVSIPERRKELPAAERRSGCLTSAVMKRT